MTYLLSLATRTNPSTDIEWFVLSPYLGGHHSAITKQSNTAFGHRDLMIVWEVYAKTLSKNEIDLVDLVSHMSQDLTPIQAVCEYHLSHHVSRFDIRSGICGSGIDRFGIPSIGMGR